MENKNNVNKIKKNKKENKKEEIKEKEIEDIEEDEDDFNSNDENVEIIDNPNNKWSKFILNNKLSSNLNKIFPEPTNIQNKTLIYTNAKVDLIIQARTGEGKTLCYAIPVLNYILNFWSHQLFYWRISLLNKSLLILQCFKI